MSIFKRLLSILLCSVILITGQSALGSVVACEYEVSGNAAEDTQTTRYTYARDAWNDPVITEAYTYGYYTDGNQRMKMDGVSGKKTVYLYDAAGRLISETESVSGTVTQAYVYTYDASGNRLSLTATGNEAYTVNYTYDKANRLLTEARTENSTTETKTYTYDPNGNLLTMASNGTVLESYTYDAFGKMVSYTKNGTTTSYTYRPDGLLYTKQTGTDASTKKYFAFSDGQMVYEQTGTDNIGAVIYSYGLTRISAKSRESLAESQEILYYYLYNAHGDVVRIIGSDRITVTTYDYDAFGNDRNTANALISDTNPFRYCGEYFDTATGTYFLRARWYDPSTGRFTQQDSWTYYDPNDPLSLNLYVYCYGNPIRYNDPQGNASVDLLDDQNQPDENNDPKNTGGGGGHNSNSQPSQGKTSGSALRGSATTNGLSSGNVYEVKTKTSHLSKQNANRIKAEMSSGRNIKFRSKSDAIDFMEKFMEDIPEGVSGRRSATGWHLDLPHGQGGMSCPHINVYSKTPYFRVHLIWE